MELRPVHSTILLQPKERLIEIGKFLPVLFERAVPVAGKIMFYIDPSSPVRRANQADRQPNTRPARTIGGGHQHDSAEKLRFQFLAQPF